MFLLCYHAFAIVVEVKNKKNEWIQLLSSLKPQVAEKAYLV